MARIAISYTPDIFISGIILTEVQPELDNNCVLYRFGNSIVRLYSLYKMK